jgi:hypothetical protein
MLSPNHVKIGPTIGQNDVGLFGGKLGQFTIKSSSWGDRKTLGSDKKNSCND